MDRLERIKVLTKLADVGGDKAETLFAKEYGKIAPIMGESLSYPELHDAIEILGTFAHRVPEDASSGLVELIERIDKKNLENPSEYDQLQYYSSSAVQVEAIGLLIDLRYLVPDLVAAALFDLSKSRKGDVKKAALEGLEKFATIELKAFGQVRVTPQSFLLDKIEAFDDKKFGEYSEAVFRMLPRFFASQIEGTDWYYDKVSLNFAPIPGGDDIKDLRHRALGMARRIYFLDDSINWKLQLIGVFQGAASSYSRQELSDEAREIICQNTIDVLDFYRQLVSKEVLQIVQRIEHDSYWIYHHAMSEKVENEALKIEKAISSHHEYLIYKELVGYEGIFGDWKRLKAGTEKRDYLSDDVRRKKASKWAREVNVSNFVKWKSRILNYVQIESNDLATFPIMYDFVGQLSERQPELMLEFLTEEEEALEVLLISFLRGLWVSSLRNEARTLVQKWVSGNRHLYACAKMFLSVDDLDEEIIEGILSAARSSKDIPALNMIIAVVTNNYEANESALNSFLLPTLTSLTELENADWIHEVWFRRGRKMLFASLSQDAIDAIIENLLNLRKFGHQAEEILSLIAENDPEKVLTVLHDRFNKADKDKNSTSFDAVPFTLYKLNGPLAKHPSLVVRSIRIWYDGDSSMFRFKGARLLHLIFPDFPEEFETQLLTIVKKGSRDDLRFVLSVLHNYTGQPFIHKICRKIVEALPKNSELMDSVSIALMSTPTVMGEYGMAIAYEKKAEEISYWRDDKNAKVRKFATKYIESLKKMIVDERLSVEVEIELRKYKYGVSKEEDTS